MESDQISLLKEKKKEFYFSELSATHTYRFDRLSLYIVLLGTSALITFLFANSIE